MLTANICFKKRGQRQNKNYHLGVPTVAQWVRSPTSEAWVVSEL